METPEYIKVGAAVRLRNGERRVILGISETKGFIMIKDPIKNSLSTRKLNGNFDSVSNFYASFDIVGPWLDK